MSKFGLKISPQNLNLLFMQYLSYHHPDIKFPFEVEGKDTTSFFQIRLELVKFVHNNDCPN